MSELNDIAIIKLSTGRIPLRSIAEALEHSGVSMRAPVGASNDEHALASADEIFVNSLIQDLGRNVVKFADNITRSSLDELRESIKIFHIVFNEKIIKNSTRILALNYSTELPHYVDALEAALNEIQEQLDTVEETNPPALPAARSAPLQVEIRNDIVTLVSSHTKRGAIDYPSANRFRESLKGTFADLVQDLPSSSNVDKRYIKECATLLEYLSHALEDISIEALGMQYQLVDRMTKGVAGEIGSAMLVELEHVISNVGILLNQFEEWQNYLVELEKTKLDVNDGDALVHQTSLLIEELEKPGAPVDGAVVKRLREMIEPALSGIVSADTVAIPLVCSLSNLFSLLSRVAIEHYQSFSAAQGHLVAAGAAAVLVRFSVDLIQIFCPTLAKFQPLKFVIDVGNYLSKLYSQLKDASL